MGQRLYPGLTLSLVLYNYTFCWGILTWIHQITPTYNGDFPPCVSYTEGKSVGQPQHSDESLSYRRELSSKTCCCANDLATASPFFNTLQRTPQETHKNTNKFSGPLTNTACCTEIANLSPFCSEHHDNDRINVPTVADTEAHMWVNKHNEIFTFKAGKRCIVGALQPEFLTLK